ISIYSLFSEHRDFRLKDRIQRASVSVMNNIAEGFKRKNNPKFKQLILNTPFRRCSKSRFSG
ncbi:MAG: four helix bundle protein, partial [Bacteroidales bacterium]|nr:four helix bundle protein [Bacteroidales bacterium]